MSQASVQLPADLPQNPLPIVDLSEFRPEHKQQKAFRNYKDSSLHDRVARTYREMHTHQTVQFVRQRTSHWCSFNHAKLSMMQVIRALDALIDESDPDIDLPNSVHAFQTAERIRERHPDKEWLVLTGFIHDAGKIMRLYNEEMWATVGDTFPVGLAPRDSIVFGVESFADNPDAKHPIYGTRLGMYEEKCGIDSLLMSWSHDEYLYRVLQHNGHRLPQAALDIVRYHSFYPWHTGGDYRDLHREQTDDDKLYWVRAFNQFDLYSKSEQLPDVEALTPYYTELIDRFLPNVMEW